MRACGAAHASDALIRVVSDFDRQSAVSVAWRVFSTRKAIGAAAYRRLSVICGKLPARWINTPDDARFNASTWCSTLSPA